MEGYKKLLLLFAELVYDYNFKFKSIEHLLISANEVVTAYEQRIKDETDAFKRKIMQPDEDGWITVTKKSFSFYLNHILTNKKLFR